MLTIYIWSAIENKYGDATRAEQSRATQFDTHIQITLICSFHTFISYLNEILCMSKWNILLNLCSIVYIFLNYLLLFSWNLNFHGKQFGNEKKSMIQDTQKKVSHSRNCLILKIQMTHDNCTALWFYLMTLDWREFSHPDSMNEWQYNHYSRYSLEQSSVHRNELRIVFKPDD